MDFENMSQEELIREIKRLHRDKKFGLLWEEKPENIDLILDDYYPVLTNVTERDILKNTQKPVNLLIEGDNLHSLMLLSTTHQEKVDVIYIDPPYNTNNKDFRYNDSYIDKEDVWKHSKWVSFMNKRLKVAKTLLKTDGVVFISINEEELFPLKLLCDEIFGPSNYLTTFSVKVRHENRILKGDKDFHEVIEYLLMYRRNDFKTVKRIEDNTSLDEYVYDIHELTDTPDSINLGGKEVKIFKPGEYEVTKSEPSESRLKKINIRGTLKEGNSSGRFYMAYLDQFKENHEYLYKVPDIGDDGRGFRYFMTPTPNRVNGDYYQGVPLNREDTKLVPYPNFLDFESDFNNVGYEGGVDFRNGKKPINFLLHILEMAGLKQKDNAVILDFFAGSGSTAHAVMKFNKDNNKNHTFIVCTNNEISEKEHNKLIRQGIEPGTQEYEENGICLKTTYPRMINIFNGYTITRKEKVLIHKIKLTETRIKKGEELITEFESKEEEFSNSYEEFDRQFEDGHFVLYGVTSKNTNIEGFDSNLKYYKTDTVLKNRNKDQMKIIMAQKIFDLLCIAENCFELVEDKPFYRIYKQGDKVVGIYTFFLNNNMGEFIGALKNYQENNVCIYSFSFTDSIDETIFTEIQNVKVKPIPAKILEILDSIRGRI